MPGFDGTGPLGQGPRTGGGFGFCPPGAGAAAIGAPPGVVYGIGRGGLPRGGGRGRCFGGGRGFWGRARWPIVLPTPAPGQEADLLKRQAEALQGQLDAIQKRLDELSSGTAKD